MEAAKGWVNDILPPRTLKAHIDDALHHLKMAILTVMSILSIKRQKSGFISTTTSNKRIPMTWELPKDG